MTSLKKRAVDGLFWTFLERFSLQGISFVISIMLARLLMPEEFGLIGMVTVFIAIAMTLRDSGLTSSLIRTKDPDESDYSTVFFTNLIASIVLYALLFFLAPFIAAFFNKPELTTIVQVLGLKIIIGAFSSVQNTRLTKAMKFKKQLTIQVPSVVVGGVGGIAFAYLGYGVWSLVYMNLIQFTVASIQLWFTSDWRPRFIFSKEKFKTHFSFGYKLTLSGLLDTVYQNIYHIIIGKYFSAAQLGFYTRAQSTKQLPVANISAALNKVTYPMLAEIQHDDKKLKEVYRRLMQQVLFWIAPLLTGAGVLAEPLFRFLFTEKWLPAVPYFQILCIVGIMYPLHAYNLNVLLVKGRSDLFLRLEIIKKIYVTIGVFLAIPFGIMGLLYFQVLSTFVAFFINTHYSGKLIHYKVWEQVKDIAPIFLMSAVMGVACYGIDFYLSYYQVYDWVRISVTAVTGALVYLALAHLSKSAAYSEFKLLVLKHNKA
jgi:O-antigen/teichoic acid export membrane protein